MIRSGCGIELVGDVPRALVGSFFDASASSSARLSSFSLGAAMGMGAPDMIADREGKLETR
jgi:hypothetical protein